MVVAMARPHLLLCFDAFGTLFRPKRSVAQQYAEVARRCGVTGFSDAELEASLKAAFKDEARRNPNYGRATGLGATRWWTNIIHKTFTPFIHGRSLPSDLASRLLHRFASKEGYDAEPNLASSLRALKRPDHARHFDRIVIGVITNSDDRVPDILQSFDVKVSPLRYGTDVDAAVLADQSYDVDFHCMSYDVGVEKPDRRIFDAASGLLVRILATREGRTEDEVRDEVSRTWRRVYVGDEHAKDVVGARNAGWSPVLLDPDDHSAGAASVEDHRGQTLDELFKEHGVLRYLLSDAVAASPHLVLHRLVNEVPELVHELDKLLGRPVGNELLPQCAPVGVGAQVGSALLEPALGVRPRLEVTLFCAVEDDGALEPRQHVAAPWRQAREQRLEAPQALDLGLVGDAPVRPPGGRQVDGDAKVVRRVDKEALLAADVDERARGRRLAVVPIHIHACVAAGTALGNRLREGEEAQQAADAPDVAVDVEAVVGEPPAEHVLGHGAAGRVAQEGRLRGAPEAVRVRGDEGFGEAEAGHDGVVARVGCKVK
ncbi:putative haloacid dehalogenase protein [Purpureocillium lavendulum]|uniref:Haloacid dehalogenase protein n=1 Tax=Purpureocillium lavendulum TaxID=1247861 RepID=A0AB34FWJ8_9HYPO|nr:putative haloacid dehalogenase protein [Purpureocillium lavendulum]